MAVLRIDNFGGEIPRAPIRALPPGAAQVNSNLLATATEFRPLQDDTAITSATSGAKTLYRLSKGVSGAVHASDSTGWITEVADKNYVKGQINDDGTERTYVTFNDGTQKPRAIDAMGADRLMGVPAPFFATATPVEGESFVMEEAQAWVDGTLSPALEAAFIATLPATTVPANQLTSRAAPVTSAVASSVPVAGAYSGYGMRQVASAPWLSEYFIELTTAKSSGLNDPAINPVLTATTLAIRVHCLPYWGSVGNTTALSTALRALESPRDGSQLFTDAQITAIVEALVKRFNPDDASIKTLRTSLDTQVKSIQAAIEFVLSVVPISTTPPVKPTVPEFFTVTTGFGEGVSQTTERALDWVAYDAALAVYNGNADTRATAQTKQNTEKTAKVAAIAAAQAAAAKIAQEIEDVYIKRLDTLAAWIKEMISERGIAKSDGNPDGLIKVDSDRVVDSRFYIVTYVNDWGEESAPTPPTAMLEVDQYSSVAVGIATFPSGRNLVGWRIYRSNVGSAGAAFQMVTDNSAAVAVLSGTAFDYFRMAAPIYMDKKKGSELGEVCPTITWSEPPYRMQSGSVLQPVPAKGSDPHLRGLVGMPNGVMAGYIDNFVAFCDPYHPYAWPVEYQIPLKYDIVGLGVFGQSLFVGTTANPSIISGSDSASMSEQMLDDVQACVSARSIVSMGGGVLYASPDGICIASGNGVQVITTALFAREDWQKLLPSSIRAAAHEGIYYFWYSGVYGGVTGGCLALDMVAKKLTRVSINASAVFTDSLTDAVFYVSGSQVKRAFSAGRRTGLWKSGKTVLPSPAPFAWLQMDGDQSPANPATVRWYGDGQLRHTATMTDIAPVRLPPGRYLEHEIEIESSARITKVALAGNTQEIQSS